MHLTYSDSKYKGKTYKSYSIAESYRDGKKVRKRILWPIGKLSDIQAEQIKLICKTVENTDQLQTQLKDVAVLESRAYLDIAVVNELWNQWQLDQAFDYDVTAGALPTNMIAKILTINRCTDPYYYPSTSCFLCSFFKMHNRKALISRDARPCVSALNSLLGRVLSGG